jgi:hypothetical protein
VLREVAHATEGIKTTTIVMINAITCTLSSKTAVAMTVEITVEAERTIIIMTATTEEIPAMMTATTEEIPAMTATTEEIPAMTATTEETHATGKVAIMAIAFVVAAFQLIGPSRISNSVMSSAMTELSKKDTASQKITESSNTVVLVPDPTKEPIL